MVRETRLSVDSLIYPVFVVPGADVKEEIPSMPGVYHQSVDRVAEDARQVADLGIPAMLLFGLPRTKDWEGSEAWAPDGVVQQALRAIRRAAPGLVLIADTCLCEYTSHGHCGLPGPEDQPGYIDNDRSLELLNRAALAQAEAGADIVAPSDMLDGRVQAIRTALDDRGLVDTAILAYAAKYASAFYGPFREAADSAPQFGDRRGYQMDPPNGREAVREVGLDLAEGADMVMVKPALAVSRRRARGQDDLPRRAAGGLQRQRRVRDDQGRRRPGLARRAARGAGGADVDRPRRRRHDHHLLRQGRRPLAT